MPERKWGIATGPLYPPDEQIDRAALGVAAEFRPRVIELAVNDSPVNLEVIKNLEKVKSDFDLDGFTVHAQDSYRPYTQFLSEHLEKNKNSFLLAEAIGALGIVQHPPIIPIDAPRVARILRRAYFRMLKKEVKNPLWIETAVIRRDKKSGEVTGQEDGRHPERLACNYFGEESPFTKLVGDTAKMARWPGTYLDNPMALGHVESYIRKCQKLGLDFGEFHLVGTEKWPSDTGPDYHYSTHLLDVIAGQYPNAILMVESTFGRIPRIIETLKNGVSTRAKVY